MLRLLLTFCLFAAAPVAAQTTLHWSAATAQQLADAIGHADDEGLNPADYDAGRVRAAIKSGDPDRIDAVATAAVYKLAADYRYGRVRGDARVDWHMGDEVDNTLLTAALSQGIASGDVTAALTGLLPSSDDYRGLKAALADTPKADTARRDRLRVNLERWRWMPRELGDRYVFVNVPTYRVEYRDGGSVTTHDAIVGKSTTPTPAFRTQISGAIVNPTWAVPASLKAEKLAYIAKHRAAAQREGFSVERRPGGYTIWQKPGPQNALGRIKLVMPNKWDIYLHDTPNRGLFARSARALSHGCVRVKDPVDFAQTLMDDGGAQVDEALATGETTRVDLPQPVPVYVAYFTAAAGADGTVKALPDLYARDAAVASALNGSTSGSMQLAAN